VIAGRSPEARGRGRVGSQASAWPYLAPPLGKHTQHLSVSIGTASY
jgi:hypothetical protein